MENLTRYSPAILNNSGVAEASMVSTNVGEFVKFSDIKELLQTSHNNRSDEIAMLYDILAACQVGATGIEMIKASAIINARIAQLRAAPCCEGEAKGMLCLQY